jgi:hypothetical protein
MDSLKKEFRREIPFTIATKNFKIPRHKLKGVKDLHNENYKALKKL